MVKGFHKSNACTLILMVDISCDSTAWQMFSDISFHIFVAGVAQIVDFWIFIMCSVKTLF